MTNSSCSSFVSSVSSFLPSKIQKAPQLSACIVFLLLAESAVAQQAASSQSGAQPSPPTSESELQTIAIPAGTRLTLVLTSSVNSRETRSGDQVYAQVTAPVILGDQVAIPAGTFVQGQVQKLTRHGTQAEMLMQSVSLVFPDGYIAKAGGPVNIESEEWTAWNNPSPSTKAGIFAAPLAGTGLGLLIGNATDKTQTTNLGSLTVTNKSHTGLVAGAAVGSAVGFAVSLVLLARSHGFYIEEGSPLNMSLPQPVTLTQTQVSQMQNAPAPPAPIAQRRPLTDHGTCYTPGTPGTPDIYISGTPPIGDSPGTPGTTIPGTPPGPPIPYPCP
jgi:hypothetical protein